jgi:uncharacterized protein YlxP (DUF503 family)
MFYGIARLEFLVPHSQSLKEKRAVLNRVKGRLESRFHLSVAEVDFQDLWQRAAIGFALVAQGAESARNGLQAARREVEQDPRLEILDFRVRVGAFSDFWDEGPDDLSGGDG